MICNFRILVNVMSTNLKEEYFLPAIHKTKNSNSKALLLNSSLKTSYPPPPQKTQLIQVIN